MADPTYSAEDMKAAEIAAGIPADKIDASTEALRKHTQAVKDATKDVSDFNDVENDSGSIMDQIQDKLTKMVGKFDELGNLTGANANEFALFATAIAGAHKELTNLSIGDTGRLGSFSDDMKGLIENVKEFKGASLVGSVAGTALTTALSAMGMSSDTASKLLTGTKENLLNVANSFLNSADNALKLQSVLLQTTVSGGAYNLFLEEAGDNLENLNKVTAKYQSIMSAGLVTGQSYDDLAKFTQSLMAMPAGYKAMTDGMDITGQHTSSLVGVIQMAQGAGLDINQTFLDINKTLAESGSSYEDSTRLIGRLGDVSKDLGAQLPEVREAIFSMTGAFKMFSTGGDQATKMNQGLTDSLKSYAWQLQQTGLPIESAIELAKKQVLGMKDLGIAQEALISQTTGGKGGIQGALEYDLLKRTDPEKAAKQMRDSMKKLMGGDIITEEQAVKTGKGDQYIKEQMLLMNGSLGMKAGSPDEAYAMINAMAQGKTPPPTMTNEQKAQRLADTTALGKTEEGLSHTPVKEMNITAQQVRLTSESLNLGMIENAVSATTGGISADAGRGRNLEAGKRGMAFMESGMNPKGDTPMIDTLHHIVQSMENMGSAVKNSPLSIGEQLTNRPKETKAEEQKSIADKIRARSQVAGMTGGGLFAGFGQPYNPAGRQVGQAIPHDNKSHITSGREPATAVAGGANGQPVPVTLVGGSGITVNFTGKCPHCNWDINSNEHATVNSPASQKPR